MIHILLTILAVIGFINVYNKAFDYLWKRMHTKKYTFDSIDELKKFVANKYEDDSIYDLIVTGKIKSIRISPLK